METIKAYLPKNATAIGIWLVLAAGVSILAYYGCIPKDTPIPLPPVPIFEPSDVQANGGWKKDDDAVKAVLAEITIKTFADTEAGKSDDVLPDAVYLWQSYSKLLGRAPPSRNQGQVGSCVSFGTGTAIERTLATQILLHKGQPDEFKLLSQEVIYGGSRVQIGKGRISGDGSVGAWAAQFVHQDHYGFVAAEKHDGYDLTTYSESTCRKFGRDGVPAALLPVCKKTPVKSVTLVKTWADAKRALASGYSVAICSNQGFSMTRDANGICRPQGSWAHCMCLDGYAMINGKECGHITNSWGESAHTGPVGPGDPPPCGFYADAATIGRMLAQDDSWAFSNVVGFPSHVLDWFVLIQPPVFRHFARHKGDFVCDFRLAL